LTWRRRLDTLKVMARTRAIPDAQRTRVTAPAKGTIKRAGAGAAGDAQAEPDDEDELDRIDDRLVIWAREIPDLDPVTEGIVERIQHLAYDFDQSMAQTLAASMLDRRAFQMLMELRRAGPPYRRSAGMLADHMRLSTGAMTNRLDRLETAGLIRRLPDPNDRRGTLIEPTDAGHAAWDQAVGTQARREAMFSKVLTEGERNDLHRLLRRLMRAFPDHEHGHTKAKTQDTKAKTQDTKAKTQDAED